MKAEHQRFAEAWVKSQNATDAYVKAVGGSRKVGSVIGSRWLKRKDVRAYIDQLRGQAVLLLQGAAEGGPGLHRIGRKTAADLAEVLAILTAQARGEAATEFERQRVTVGEVVSNPLDTTPIPMVMELLKLIPEEHKEKAVAMSRDIMLESRTMKFQPMKAAAELLTHFDKLQEQARDPGDSAWVRIMDSDPKLARMLSLRFLQLETRP